MKKALILAVALALPDAAMAGEASRSVTTSAAPDAVWAAIGDFCGIENWHPAVAECALSEHDGTRRRTLTVANDGGTIVEDLVAWDDENMTYTYKIIEAGPLPVANYESTIKVSPDGAGSRIDWVGTFDAKDLSEDEAVGAVGSHIYEPGLAAIVENAGG